MECSTHIHSSALLIEDWEVDTLCQEVHFDDFTMHFFLPLVWALEMLKVR